MEKETKESMYKFKDMVLELFNQKIAELQNQFGNYVDFDISTNGIKPITPETEQCMLMNIDRFPVPNKAFHIFSNCNFDIISKSMRKELVEVFVWHRNMFNPSVPTVESLNHAKELLNVDYKPTTTEDVAVKAILTEGTFLVDYDGEYDLDWIFDAAKDEYHNSEFADLYDSDDWSNTDLVVADYLCRHRELVIVLRRLKSMRQRIRDTFMLGNDAEVGF